MMIMPSYNPYGTPQQYGGIPNYNAYPQQNYYAIVNGLEGAKNYPLMANQTMLLMDSNEPIAYKKTANGLGQTTIEAFKLVPIVEEHKEEPQVEYALKADITKLQKKIDELTKLIKKEPKEVENNA